MDADGRELAAQEAARTAREAMSASEWPTAALHWRRAIENAPERPAAYASLANALGLDGSGDEAERVLSDARARFPHDLQIATAWAQSAQRNRDWSVALDRWKFVESRFGATILGALGQIDALRNAGIGVEPEVIETAKRVLEEAGTGSEDTPAGRRLAFEVAFVVGDLGTARDAAERLMSAPQRAPAFVRLAQQYWRDRNFAEAERAASNALANDPTAIAARILLARIATENGDGEAALAHYARLIECRPDVSRWRLRRIDLLNWMGRLQEATRELDQARQAWPDDPTIRNMLRTFHPEAHMIPDGPDAAAVERSGASDFELQLQAIARKAPAIAVRVRPLVSTDLTRDVLIAPARGANVLLLVFTGANDGLSIPAALFDRFLATINVSAVYLKDFQRVRYLKGIQSLAPDYTGTISELQTLAKELGAKRLMTLGNCAGGFAAARYGVEMGAERVIGFDPLTHQGVDTFESVENGISFLRRQLTTNGLTAMADLRAFINSKPCNADIHVHYNEDRAETRDDALRVDGLRGVRMFGHHAGDHGASLRHLAATRDFVEVLAKLLA